VSLAELMFALGVIAVLGGTAVRGSLASAELRGEIRSLEALRDEMRSYYRRHCGSEELPHGGWREFFSLQALQGQLDGRLQLAPGLEEGRWRIVLFHGAPAHGGADVGRVELQRPQRYARRDRALAHHLGGRITQEGVLHWRFLLAEPLLPVPPAMFARYFNTHEHGAVSCHAG